MIKNSWDKYSFEANLVPPDIHIWRTWLDRAETNLDLIAAGLSEEERTTARKFHFARDRQRYIVSHAALREILSQYLRIPSTELNFKHNEFGKPVLETNPENITFNISHSENMALFAFTYQSSIGVDIEHLHPIKDIEGVANSFLSTSEMKTFLDLPEELQLAGFFCAWTRKEALSKAIGKGISLPLDKLGVGVNPTQGPKLTFGKANNLDQTKWQLTDLSPSPGYVGAVAVERLEISLKLFTFPETLRDF